MYVGSMYNVCRPYINIVHVVQCLLHAISTLKEFIPTKTEYLPQAYTVSPTAKARIMTLHALGI